MALIMEISDKDAAAALLRWYVDMGVDESVESNTADLYSWNQSSIKPDTKPRPSPWLAENPQPKTAPANVNSTEISADEAIAAAKALAAASDDFDALNTAVSNFEGCPLKAGANNTVFADGVPGSQLLVIGEAPGQEEDRVGKPFVGRAGQLLDRMLAAIDHSRDENVLISNVIYWRPPGNRTPTPTETAICGPFVERLIELTDPKAILLAGGAPTQALLGLTGIMRNRGVWREITTSNGASYPVLPIFHPAFLLRQPTQKRLAWSDLLSLQARLRDS